MSAYRIALLALALLTAACDRGPTGPDALLPGTFEATTTGALDLSLAGPAALEQADDGTTSLWLSDTTVAADSSAGSPEGVLVALQSAGALPGKGSYAVGSPEEDGDAPFTAAWVIYYPDGAELLISASGTVRITSSSPERVAGDFDIAFVPPGDDGAGADTSRVRGRFDAAPAAVPPPGG